MVVTLICGKFSWICQMFLNNEILLRSLTLPIQLLSFLLHFDFVNPLYNENYENWPSTQYYATTVENICYHKFILIYLIVLLY